MQHSKLRTAAICCFLVTAALFLLFFLYMGISENISVESARSDASFYTLSDYTYEEIEDPSAPIGIRREYRWTWDEIGEGGSTLAFYLVHHNAEVYFGDELMYRLASRDSDTIGLSPSSNWVIIPVYSSDSGKEVRVVVTPVYESVRHRAIDFQIGSFHSIYLAQLKHDLPQLILAVSCLLLGAVVTLVQFVLIHRRKARRRDIFFLGNLSILLGVWKITDTRFSPFLFSGNPKLLGYLAIGALFLAGIPLALYLHDRFTDTAPTLTLILSLVISGAALLALLLQVFGIADFRQTLPLAHIAIILLLAELLFIVLFRRIHRKTPYAGRSIRLFLLLIFGAAIDFLLYYVTKSSSGLVFTPLAFLLYTLSLFTTNLISVSKRAYTDVHTGLFNKSRWDILMEDASPVPESLCIIMMDLNGLKRVNDTMGHEAGDKMIFNFANILRNTIPSSNTICRWGGDEFSVMLTDANTEKAERCLADIRAAVDAYNASGEKPVLDYAVGYALASEFPGAGRAFLFQKADERMYRHKRQQHTRRIPSEI